ncbi:MAG: hypothetical protein R6V10_10905, partial [bacterium]
LDYTPYAQRAAKGSTLNSDSIEDIEILFPDKSTRKKIVNECKKAEEEREYYNKKICESWNKQNIIVTDLLQTTGVK